MKILRHLECLKKISPNQFTITKTKDTPVRKYLLSFSDLLDILSNKRKEYYLVAPDLNLLKDIEITYYDTSQLTFYRQLLVGGIHKLKIRRYNCSQSHMSFIEVIDYNNFQESTRFKISPDLLNITTLSDPKIASFIEKYLPTSPSLLKPVLGISYKKFELISCDGSEQVSINFNISFYNNTERKYLEHTVIAEIKQAHSSTCYFDNIMQVAGANMVNVSKYRLGFLMLYPTFFD
jgi:hypothetical protein